MRIRPVLLCLLLCVAGCAQQPPQTEPPEVPPPVRPRPPPPVEVPPQPQPEPPAAVTPPPTDIDETRAERIAIVLSDRTPAYENVATELGRMLDDYLLYNLADRSLAPPDVFDAIAEMRAGAVIAIGLVATREAALRSPVPVVFCQVFNIAPDLDSRVPVRGVASTPPLAQQLAAWKQFDPELESIGTILGPGHDALIDEGRAAAAAHGVAFHHRIVRSDREALFTFQRMAPAIDGFWLLPDNRVLSISMLEDLLDHASRQDVDVAVFNHALLEMGATLSVATVDADIAVTALAVVSRILAGNADAMPWMTPLNDLKMATRDGVRAAAGADGGVEP